MSPVSRQKFHFTMAPNRLSDNPQKFRDGIETIARVTSPPLASPGTLSHARQRESSPIEVRGTHEREQSYRESKHDAASKSPKSPTDQYTEKTLRYG